MQAALEVSGLTKRYPGFDLRDVSFTLPQGYVLGLIGPNGAGKTTIIKSILNIVKKDSGDIRIFGCDSENDESRAKAYVGFVHEVPPLFDHLNVRDYARLVGMYYADWDENAFESLARRFELPLKKRTAALSRGMKMKLSLATALSHSADLLILDEPTSGLDPVFRRELLDYLYDTIQDGKRSVLFSTHVTSDLEHIADYIVYVRGGSIRFSDSVEAIRDTWRLVNGDPSILKGPESELFPVLRCEPHSFTALTRHPDKVLDRFGNSVVLDRPSFDDLVYYLDGENDGE